MNLENENTLSERASIYISGFLPPNYKLTLVVAKSLLPQIVPSVFASCLWQPLTLPTFILALY